MNESIISVLDILEKAENKQFINISSYSHLKIAIQKIDGEHRFNHINKEAYEHIIVLKGSLSIRTSREVLHGKPGDLLTIPRNMAHGDITGKDACIMILENFSEETQ